MNICDLESVLDMIIVLIDYCSYGVTGEFTVRFQPIRKEIVSLMSNNSVCMGICMKANNFLKKKLILPNLEIAKVKS